MFMNYKPDDLFNKHTMKILDHTPQKVITEMAVRLFVGSRDIPKDIPKAMKLLEIAKSKGKTDQTEKEK